MDLCGLVVLVVSETSECPIIVVHSDVTMNQNRMSVLYYAQLWPHLTGLWLLQIFLLKMKMTMFTPDDGPTPLVVIPVLLQYAASLGQACSLLENIINNQSCITI